MNEIYIIDSYRTPIERKYQAFFKHISVFLSRYIQIIQN